MSPRLLDPIIEKMARMPKPATPTIMNKTLRMPRSTAMADNSGPC